MAHVRRKLFDVAESTGSPVAKEALERIAKFYAVEKRARGRRRTLTPNGALDVLLVRLHYPV